jgi:hypothetical protein
MRSSVKEGEEVDAFSSGECWAVKVGLEGHVADEDVDEDQVYFVGLLRAHSVSLSSC